MKQNNTLNLLINSMDVVQFYAIACGFKDNLWYFDLVGNWFDKRIDVRKFQPNKIELF